MTPIRTIIHGAIVTIHSDCISVSVTRYVPKNFFNGRDRVYYARNNRNYITHTKRKSLSEIKDIDEFVDAAISELRSKTEEFGMCCDRILITAADL